MSCDNFTEAWTIFKSLFTSVIDKVTPVKNVRIKQRTEPWVDEVLVAIKTEIKPVTFISDLKLGKVLILSKI